MADFEQLQAELMTLPQIDGVMPVDILSVPQPLGPVIRGLVKDRTVSSSELAAALDFTSDQAIALGDILVEKGYLDNVEEAEGEEPVYRIRYARVPKHDIPLDL
jgi:hypothetical protein